MNRRGFLATLAGVFGAAVTGQAVKFSDLKALAEPVTEKLVGYRTYIMGSGSFLKAQQVLFDKELIPNLKGETDVFVKLAERRVLPGAVVDLNKYADAIPGWVSYKVHNEVSIKPGINRQFFRYDTLSSNEPQKLS